MKYFVEDKFEQTNGAIGSTSTPYDDLKTAKMIYHQVLAGHYVPDNLETTKWACVSIISQVGSMVENEYIDNTQVETAD